MDVMKYAHDCFNVEGRTLQVKSRLSHAGKKLTAKGCSKNHLEHANRIIIGVHGFAAYSSGSSLSQSDPAVLSRCGTLPFPEPLNPARLPSVHQCTEHHPRERAAPIQALSACPLTCVTRAVHRNRLWGRTKTPADRTAVGGDVSKEPREGGWRGAGRVARCASWRTEPVHPPARKPAAAARIAGVVCAWHARSRKHGGSCTRPHTNASIDHVRQSV